MNKRPKIGLALSGGSGRAIAHIGVLEVLKENNIPLDVITACSSGAIIAGAYGCGTMQELKNDLLEIDADYILDLFRFDKTGEGVFATDKVVEWMRKYANKDFQDVSPRIGFVCVDIITGKPELLALGDIAKAGQASCAIPGLFKPVEWGNKLLVDGGLFSIVPINEARNLGADIVIGVDIAATRQIIEKRYLNVWYGYNFVRKSLLFRIFGRLFNLIDWLYKKTVSIVFYNQSDFLQDELTKEPNPHLFSILDRAMKLVTDRQKAGLGGIANCDVMITPNVKHFGRADFEKAKEIYLEGRRVAFQALPDIEKAISEYNWRRNSGQALKKNHVKTSSED